MTTELSSKKLDLNKLLDWPARDFMRKVLTAVTPDTSLAAAARLFQERHVTGAPVVDEDGRAVGVISTKDLINPNKKNLSKQGTAHYAVMLNGHSVIGASVPDIPQDQLLGTVGEVMNANVVSVNTTDSLRAAITLMVSKKIHRVLVVDDGKLVGLISSMDVLRNLVPAIPDLDDDDQGF